jgi:hypothetical protein
MNNKDKKKAETEIYYVNPNVIAEPEAKVFCTNTLCVNFIPVHQTCNLKTILISADGKCEFSVKRKKAKLKAYEKPNQRTHHETRQN